VIADRLHDMAVTLEGLTGQKPMIYTSNGFWNASVGGQWDGYFATLPLWVAHWTTQPQPLLPRGWNQYKLWQFTDKSAIDGFAKPVDRNRLAT
jgi:GH25 family lysozyme M1 (1,4-beta-N-acetylmuramidase)